MQYRAVEESVPTMQFASKPMWIAELYPPQLDSRLRGNECEPQGLFTESQTVRF